VHLGKILTDVHSTGLDYILRLWHSNSLQFDTGLLLNLFDEHLRLGCVESDASATGSSSSSTTASVNVGLCLLRWLNLDDKVDVWNIKASGSNIGSDEHAEFSLLESLHGYLTLILSNVTVHDLDVLLDLVGEEQ